MMATDGQKEPALPFHRGGAQGCYCCMCVRYVLHVLKQTEAEEATVWCWRALTAGDECLPNLGTKRLPDQQG